MRGVSISDLYGLYPQLTNEKNVSWAEAITNAALQNIYNGHFDITNDIEPNLFNATWRVLNNAIDTAFGDVNANNPDFEFVNELKYNNGVFAAFKTHRQQTDLAALLVDNEGNPRSFGEFEKACRPTLDGYNRNWLQTEYNTATTRARFAANVKNFERDAKHFPNMRWTPSRSAEPRTLHEQFYGLVLPINDPFWAQHHPGDLYNCKCGIEQTNEPAHQRPKVKTEPVPGLDTNPAQTGALFSNSHPYISNATRQAKNAVKQLPALSRNSLELMNWAENVIESKKPGGQTKPVGTFDKKVIRFAKAHKLQMPNNSIVLSDRAVLHMTRKTKKRPPDITDIAKIKGYLQTASVYFDRSHNNFIYFIQNGNPNLLKFVVQPNYTIGKNSVNYVVTGGYVSPKDLLKEEYIKVKD